MVIAAPTVTHSRTQSLTRRIARLDSGPNRLEAVTLGLVDALLERDDETLAAALQSLRDARARADGDPELVGQLDAAIAFAHWGLERVPSRAAVALGTQAHDFLSALDGSQPVGSADLRRVLDVDETQVSRTGRRLLEGGLVNRSKVGRQAFWQLTPRGQRALEEASEPGASANSEFWQEALRRGFDDEPRRGDPTRHRIIESTRELHATRGVQATTWSEIADRAEVPVEIVEELFPTLDDLARGCGEHVLESLQMPPCDRAPDVFAGASNDHDRIHRLVETFFGVYERGAGPITAARQEREAAVAVDESIRELDRAFDALVVEVLPPQRRDRASVASLRALTDLEVWRTLRDQGATPEAAVDQASGVVERWLESQPAR